MSQPSNPVIETYKGVNVRRCNRVVLKFGIASYKKLLDEIEDTGLSVMKLLAHSSRPCEKCELHPVIVYDADGNAIKVKRGILSNHIPENNGINITANAKSNRMRKENK